MKGWWTLKDCSYAKEKKMNEFAGLWTMGSQIYIKKEKKNYFCNYFNHNCLNKIENLEILFVTFFLAK